VTPPTWAVIPTAGRPLLHDCLASVRDQVDGIVIVANGGYSADDIRGVAVVHDHSTDRNISRWWNLGLDELTRLGHAQWNALVLNDDVTLGAGAVLSLAATMRIRNAAMAFLGSHERVLTAIGGERVTGWCFMLRGESALRADESMAWWASDNDIDWNARGIGGSVTVPNVPVVHHDPNGYTNRVPELAEQAGLDVETFRQKWGRLPW
jgi:hypothetical protein